MEQQQKDSVAQRRAAMPVAAEFIDFCRARYGDLVDVDAQLATAVAAQREYAQVLAQHGEVAARRWHRANAHRCTFFASEGGRTVGMPCPFDPTPTGENNGPRKP